MEQEMKQADCKSENSNSANDAEKEIRLKTEFLRAQFFVELFCDLIEFQKRSNQHLEEAEKLMRDRKRKKRRSKWEVRDGAEHQKNQ